MARQGFVPRIGPFRRGLIGGGTLLGCLAATALPLSAADPDPGYGAPDLVLYEDAPAHALVGTAVRYDVLVGNVGLAAVPGTDVHVTDREAAAGELVYVADRAGDGDDVLEPGEAWEYGLPTGGPVSLTETACRDLVNTAQVAPVAGEIDTANNARTVTTRTHCGRDVEIAKTSDKAAYRPGDTIFYTITVTNESDVALPLANVHVSDAMLADLAPESPAPVAIPAGGSQRYVGTKLVTDADCGRLRNRAEVVVDREDFSLDPAVGQSVLPADPTMNRGIGSDQREHAEHEVLVTCKEDLQIDKVADKQTYLPGETISYTVTVTNSGDLPIAVNRIHVSDPLLSNLGLAASAPERLAVGAKLVYTGTRSVTTADCGPIVNVATVSLDPDKPRHKPKDREHHKGTRHKKHKYDRDGEKQMSRAGAQRTHHAKRAAKSRKATKGKTHPKDRPPRETDTATVTVNVLCPINLTVAKTADKATYAPGETVTYTVTVKNTGTLPIPVSQIQVSDPTLPNLALVGMPPVDLVPNASLTYVGTRLFTAENCGNVTNTVTVATPNDSNPSDNAASVTVSVAGALCSPPVVTGMPATPVPPVTTLLLDKDSNPSSRGRRPIAYQITVTNTGTGKATGVVVRDRIPEGLAVVRVPRGAVLKGGVIRWAVGDIAPGATKTVGVWMRPVRNQARRICNTAEAGGSNTPVTQDTRCLRVIRVAGVTRTPVTG